MNENTPADERALFDKAFLSWNGFHTQAELDHEWNRRGGLAATMFREGFRAAVGAVKHRAPPALDAEGLPELPEPRSKIWNGSQWVFAWIAEEVRQVQREAVEADRQGRAGEGCTEFIPLYDLPDVATVSTAAATTASASRDAMREAWQVLMDAGVIPGLAPMSLAEGIRAALALSRAADGQQGASRAGLTDEQIKAMFKMLADDRAQSDSTNHKE